MYHDRRRRSAAAATALAVAAVSIVAAAVLADGEAQAEVTLNDAGVWVTKTSAGLVGRFNTQSQAMDGTLLAGATAFDVTQQAGRVLVSAGSAATPVDPAHLTLGSALAAPADALVAAGGATTAVLDPADGRLWVLPFDGLAGFDPETTDPVAELPAGRAGALDVALDGTVLAAVPGVLVRVPTSSRGVPGEVERQELDVASGARLEVTAVGSDAVVLDRTAGAVILPGGKVVPLPGAADGRLQQRSSASDHVLVATPDGLVSQPLDGGAAVTRAASGVPAAPVQLGGCSYGAWAQTGQVLRDCPGTDADADQTLDGLGAGASLAYRVNRDAIVLNDLAAGTLWLPATSFQKVDDWDQAMPDEGESDQHEAESSTPEQVDQAVAPRDQPNRPPLPHDDTFGVRPGRTVLLDVLGNDVDPDGDVMTASVERGVDGLPVIPVLDGTALQVAVPQGATEGGTLTYAASDGRGQSPTAQAAVRVIPDGENTAPVQQGEPVLTVGRGQSAVISVLPYFRDPEGDDLLLAAAGTTAGGVEVRFGSDGAVTVLDGGTATGRVVVDLVVADSFGATVDGRLLVDVVAGDAPPVAVNDHVTVSVGEALTVAPLANDVEPNGQALALVSVGGQDPATVEVNAAAGTFRFRSDEPGAYDLPYDVSDGTNVSTGLVRVDVLAPPDGAAPPVAVSDRVLLPAGGRALVDVLANDTNPSGGVLVVRSVQVPPDSGLSVAVLAHQVLEVTEVRRLEGPVTLTYTVADGDLTATGEVRVIPVPAPEELRAPEARADEAVVHVGDVVTIPVLRNDTHPDGLALAVAPGLVEQPESGEAFVAEDTVRFKAGAEAGTVHLVYAVTDANGQRDSAQVTVRVLGGAENAAPQVPDVEARVLAGGSVRIALPLDGADPDGDLVTLDGVATPPAKGTVRAVDGRLEYTASTTEAGTDTFTYRVTDTRGATAVATVRVGIAHASAANQPPVAVDDVLHVRPGRRVAIDAVANDADPDGDRLGLVRDAIEGGAELSPEVVDGVVTVRTPSEPGVYSFYYGVEDPFGAQATGSVTVDVDPVAPLLAPVARDDVVTSADVSGPSVVVDVLANDDDPDGTRADLAVGVDDAERRAGVRAEAGRLVIPLGPAARVLTYTVTDADGLTGKAFVRVPRDGAAPRLRDGLDLEAVAGEPLTLDLTALVTVAPGRAPQLTSESLVTASPGRRDVVDRTTVTYTAPEDFAGTGWVTFEVADGDPGALDTRSAVLSVPVTVRPAANRPPVFTGRPTLEVAAGEDASVDVARFMTDPDGDPLTVRTTGATGVVTVSVSGQVLTGQVGVEVPKGTQVAVPVEVSDGVNPPVRGDVLVTVVASTRPLARAVDDVVEDAHQGAPVTVDVLANDTDPFPGAPLRLLAADVETGTGTVAVEGDHLVVTPDAEFEGRLVVRYRVGDATGDPDREVEGRVQVTVLGAPEAPRAPQVVEVRSQTVVLSWNPPVDNGAPITGYTVHSDQGTSTPCPTTTCTVTGLRNTVTHTFTVVATNDVGDSDASPASVPATPDASPDPPAAPTLAFGDKSLAVTWTTRTYTDRSPVTCVNLEISPAPAAGPAVRPCVTGTSTAWTGLANGTAYRVRAQAVNEAPTPSGWGEWSAAMTPARAPAAPAAPTATRVSTALGGEVTVSWSAPADNGDPIDGYVLSTNGGTPRTVTGTSLTLTGLASDQTYTFTVHAVNKAGSGPESASSNAVVPYGTPDTPGAPSVALGADTDGKATVTWSPIASNGFHGSGGYYRVQANGAGARQAASPYVWTGLTNTTSSTFQVQACNAFACSAWSSASNAVQPYGTPPAPLNVRAVATGNPDIPAEVIWNPITAAEFRGPDGHWEVQIIGVTDWHRGNDATTATGVFGIVYPTTYGPFEVRACNAFACGPVVTVTGPP